MSLVGLLALESRLWFSLGLLSRRTGPQLAPPQITLRGRGRRAVGTDRAGNTPLSR